MVHISEFALNSILAEVKGQNVEIKNLGSDNFYYKCSCGVWHADVKRGTLPYCIHYLYVLAELIRQGSISKTKSRLNRLDDEGFNRLGSLMAEISSYETGLEEFRKGRILLCPSCLHSYEIGLLGYITIEKLTMKKSGFSIEGKGVCPNDGSRTELRREIEVDLEKIECPCCGKTDFKTSMKAEKTSDGYRFVAGLECKTDGCVWKKSFISETQSTTIIFTGARKLRITQDGIQIE